MFTGSVDKATTKTAGSGVYSPRLGYSELKLLYNDAKTLFMKTLQRKCKQGLVFHPDIEFFDYGAGLPAE
jgi:hypothetical protein